MSIHTKNGVLAEYGTRRLGSSSITSTFIQSEDNTPFWIKFRPSNPFDFKSSLDSRQARRAANTKPPVWGAVSGTWDFSAHIFIDDNAKSDKNLIIDLPRNGKGCDPVIVARGRSCVDQHGVPGEQPWVFKEVGLESYFKMLTTDEKLERGDDEGWEIASDREVASNTPMGQIKIQLFRVRQRGMDTTRKPERSWEGPHRQAQTSSDVDISHTVGYVKNPVRENVQELTSLLELETQSPGCSITLPSTTSTVPRSHGPRSSSCIVGRVSLLQPTVPCRSSRSPPNCIDETSPSPAEQLQKMGFTPGTGPARRNSCCIFEPGPSRSLSSNLNMAFSDNDNPDDQDNTPTKKRGLSNSISSLLENRGGSSPAGKSGESPLPKPTEVVIFVMPKPTANASSSPSIRMTPVQAC